MTARRPPSLPPSRAYRSRPLSGMNKVFLVFGRCAGRAHRAGHSFCDARAWPRSVRSAQPRPPTPTFVARAIASDRCRNYCAGTAPSIRGASRSLVRPPPSSLPPSLLPPPFSPSAERNPVLEIPRDHGATERNASADLSDEDTVALVSSFREKKPRIDRFRIANRDTTSPPPPSPLPLLGVRV